MNCSLDTKRGKSNPKKFLNIIRNKYPTSFQGQRNVLLDIDKEVDKAKNGERIWICYLEMNGFFLNELCFGEQYSTKSSYFNQALYTDESFAYPSLNEMINMDQV